MKTNIADEEVDTVILITLGVLGVFLVSAVIGIWAYLAYFSAYLFLAGSQEMRFANGYEEDSFNMGRYNMTDGRAALESYAFASGGISGLFAELQSVMMQSG